MRRRVSQRAEIILRGELGYNYVYLHLLSFSSLPASPLLCLPLLVLIYVCLPLLLLMSLVLLMYVCCLLRK